MKSLVIYDLTFIARLVAAFVLSSRTADAFLMAKWSSRNVVPAKIALEIVFAVLGALLMPGLNGWIGSLLQVRGSAL